MMSKLPLIYAVHMQWYSFARNLAFEIYYSDHMETPAPTVHYITCSGFLLHKLSYLPKAATDVMWLDARRIKK